MDQGLSLVATMESIKPLVYFGKAPRTVDFRTTVTESQIKQRQVEEVIIEDDCPMTPVPITPDGQPAESQNDQASSEEHITEAPPADVYIPDETTLLDLIGTQKRANTHGQGCFRPMCRLIQSEQRTKGPHQKAIGQ